MNYEVRFSQAAESDLRGIFEYIAISLMSPQNAAGQLLRIEKAINSLDTMPERYPRYKTEPWFSRGLGMMVVDNYCVMYISDSEKHIVTVIRVMYGGRNINEQLTQYSE